jgi:uncharacterized protein YbjT (DUF2867 family)
MILVAGASGTVGSKVVRGLEDAGLACRAMVRNSARWGAMESALCEVVEGDFFDLASLQNALDGCDAAFLLSPLDARMSEMQSNFIETCQHAGVRHVVKLSSMGASARSPVQLGKWHGEVEAQLENSGLSWTQIRPSYFMQNIGTWKNELRRDASFPWPLGDAKLSWIDAHDIAAVAVCAFEDEKQRDKRLNITGGEALGAEEVAQIISRVLEREIKPRFITLDEYRENLIQSGAEPKTADALKQLHGVLAQGHGAAVTKEVVPITGKEPRSFAQFAEEVRGQLA